MKTRTGFSRAVLATAILLLCSILVPAFAQDQDVPMPPNADQQYDQAPEQPNDQAPAEDPPTRAGRISYTDGSVSFQPGGQGDWLDAVPNRPLTTGDNLWVDKDSRAEIQIGGTSIRLGPETSVTFLDLGDNVTQLRLSLGSLYFRVRDLGDGETFEVDTPNLAFNVAQAGEFRLDVNQNGDQTDASVWRGEAEVSGAGNSYRLTSGQMGTFSGTDQLSYDVNDLPQADSFTQWCQSRNEREDQSQSRQYTSQDMTGYEDLDEYGSWQSDPDYGHVWAPRTVPADWAPYRYGHWAYVYPWGWTWVEDEPWGFAPFHYGRWAFVRSRWCWVPGPVAVRPVYAPALVAFVGGFSVSVGTAPVGWFPLGPREVYVPWYRTSPRYVQNVNVTNTRVTVVQVTNVYHNYTVNHVTNVTYVNRNVRNSVTVVNHDTFVNARPVNRNIQRIDSRQLASARVNPGIVRTVQPARQSVMGNARPVRFQPPAQALRRPVVATRQPVTVNRPAGNHPAFGRPAAPAPVRTVHAAPPKQAQPLQRGARGGPAPRGPANNGANRGAPNNAAAPRPGTPAGRPNAPENHGATPSPAPSGARTSNPENREPAPRPGNQPNGPENHGPENRGTAPRPGQPSAQPNGPGNRNAVPRPNGPGQPNSPGNRGETPRSGAPANNPGNPPRPENNHNVPRPPSANPSNQQQPRQYPGTRPENNRPQEAPQTSRPPETPQARPEQPARPAETRQEPTPRQPESRPQPAPREPEVHQQPAPRQPETRPQPSRQPESRPQPQHQPQPPSQHDNERSNPRPQARAAQPPHEKHAPASHNDRASKNDRPQQGRNRH
ncbi:MAG TPA: DUF6600 domain-containing protein [Terriglobales bacterium]